MKKEYNIPTSVVEWVQPYLMSSDTSANLEIEEGNPTPGTKPW